MERLNKKIPLEDYPWKNHIEQIILWSKNKEDAYRLFAFDLCMSLAYIDAAINIEKSFQTCASCPEGFNAHLGFINLCSPCFEKLKKWQYQKAAKPSSGVIGKLCSEMLLKFVELLHEDFTNVYAIGGSEMVDALIIHKNGFHILAEVKSAPLLTYPILISTAEGGNHRSIAFTRSQFNELSSALYLHEGNYISLGQIKQEHWPFKPVSEFIANEQNATKLEEYVQTWKNAKDAYTSKNQSELYYLANASGKPPVLAKQRDGWPNSESISDGKTSVGMDRTDDIKKAIYQVMKIGTSYQDNKDVRTAIISNLPAYRHGSIYVTPFKDLLWGNENKIVKEGNKEYILKEDLKYVFDYLITLTEPVLRDLI